MNLCDFVDKSIHVFTSHSEEKQCAAQIYFSSPELFLLSRIIYKGKGK